jgi:hypothetical protein
MPTYADVGEDASVLAELAECLQQGEDGSRATRPSVRECKWQSTLGVLTSLEPAAGRAADGGPQRSWPALRARTPAAAGAGGGAHAASKSSVLRPHTCVGVRARGRSVREADGADGVEHTGAYVGVRPQTCGRAGVGGRSVCSAAAHASAAISGGAYGSIRPHTSAARRGRERAFSGRERADQCDRLIDSSDGGGEEEEDENVVFWGGRARPPKAVLPEVRGGLHSIYVSSCYYMCPHTTVYVSAYCCMCARAIICASSYYSICVLMLLY